MLRSLSLVLPAFVLPGVALAWELAAGNSPVSCSGSDATPPEMMRVDPPESLALREESLLERSLDELLEDAERETMPAIIPDWCRRMVGTL